jgi:hypothetical protein
MPVLLDGHSYYRTAEVCRMAGISRNTLFRWVKEGNVIEPTRRDWRGWRLFTQDQVYRLRGKTNQTSEPGQAVTPIHFADERCDGDTVAAPKVQISGKEQNNA